MAAGFSRDQAAALAALANLDLDSTELDLFSRQLGEILAHAAEVQQADTTGVPATASVVTRQPSDRSDEIRPSIDRADVLAGAPDPARHAGFFRVPRVIG